MEAYEVSIVGGIVFFRGVIVEGAEQSGKSTLCDRIAKETGLKIIHMHKRYGFVDDKFDYFASYFYDIDRSPIGYVFDRSYLSEIAYGEYFQRGNITPEIRHKIENKFRKLGYLLVLCRRDAEWLDRDETVTREQNEAIKRLFEQAFDKAHMFKVRLNPEDDSEVSALLRRLEGTIR